MQKIEINNFQDKYTKNWRPKHLPWKEIPSKKILWNFILQSFLEITAVLYRAKSGNHNISRQETQNFLGISVS